MSTDTEGNFAGTSDVFSGTDRTDTCSPLAERQMMLVFLVMALGAFIALLDIQIVASSLAEIQAGLSATADEISHVQTWYLIAEVIMIPLSGWLARALSTRWLFTLSAAGFTIASLACGLAWDLESMIAFRAVQGFLGGAMIPTAFATGYLLFPGAKQTRVAAVLGIAGTCAPALGPTIGGYITETLGWRWMFFINLLPGVLIVALIPKMLRIDEPQLSLFRRLDVPGLISLALFLGCLQYVLDEGPRNAWFEDRWIQGLFWFSVINGVLFIWRSLTYDQPVVDLRAFRHRNFCLGSFLSFVTGIGLYGMVAMTSLFLTEIRGFNALQVGETVFVFGLSQLLSTPVLAALSQKIDARAMLCFGCTLYAISTWLLCSITSDWGFSEFMLSQALRGIASMSCIIVVTNVALGELAPDELKNSSGLFNLMRNLGGAIGLAALNTQLFYSRFSLHYDRLAASIAPDHISIGPSVTRLTENLDNGWLIENSGELAPEVLTLLTQLTNREALTMSFADIFFLIGASFVLALLFVPWIRPAKFVAST